MKTRKPSDSSGRWHGAAQTSHRTTNCFIIFRNFARFSMRDDVKHIAPVRGRRNAKNQFFYYCLLFSFHATETSRLGVSIFADICDKFRSVVLRSKSCQVDLAFFFFFFLRFASRMKSERKENSAVCFPTI